MMAPARQVLIIYESNGVIHSDLEQHENEETSSWADDKDMANFGTNNQHQDNTPTKPADDQMSNTWGNSRDRDGLNDTDHWSDELEPVFACKLL